jgi:hypothetical protein
MRAFEFLYEQDNELSDQELRTQLISAVNQADRKLLDRFYQILDSGDLDDKLSLMLTGENVDRDAARIKNDLVKIFITTKGSASEKKEFIEKFPQGFIDVEQLLSPSNNIDRWFTGNSFAKNMFEQTASSVRSQGIGPGEYALAAFSPMLKSTGLVGGGGDLIYGQGQDALKIEVKGKVESWGRLHDAKKMDYDMKSIKQAFSDIGIDQPTLTVARWLEIRKDVDDQTKNSLSKIVVDSLFKHVDESNKATLINSLATSDMNDIKAAWGKLSFINYKTASGFSGILFYDIPSGTTRYVTDAEDLNFRSEAPQIFGAERDAMPKTWVI